MEIIAFVSLESHHDKDLASRVDSALIELKGCGDSNFDLAIDFIEQGPVIYARPEGQTVSMILGIILFVDVFLYFLLYFIAMYKILYVEDDEIDSIKEL